MAKVDLIPVVKTEGWLNFDILCLGGQPSFTLFAQNWLSFGFFDRIFLDRQMIFGFLNGQSQTGHEHRCLWHRDFFYRDALINAQTAHKELTIKLRFDTADEQLELLGQLAIDDKKYSLKNGRDFCQKDQRILAVDNFLEILLRYYLSHQQGKIEPHQTGYRLIEGTAILASGCHN